MPNDGTICSGDNAVLDAGGSFTAYAWSDGVSIIGNTQTLTVTNPGLYLLTVTDANGCQGQATTTVVVDPLPMPTITVTETSGTTANDGTICTGDVAVLDAGMFSSYVWSTSPTDTDQTLSVTTGGTYTVSVTDGNGCIGTAEFTITENALPTPTVAINETSGTNNNDGILCAGDNATLDAGVFTSYVWSTSPTDTDQTLVVDAPGTYTVTVTDSNGCTGTGEATISNTALPTPIITISENSGVMSDDGTICSGDEAIVDAGV